MTTPVILFVIGAALIVGALIVATVEPRSSKIYGWLFAIGIALVLINLVLICI